MTEEVGAITGDLELSCRSETGEVHVEVRYAGADEWYTVSGSPVRVQNPAEDVPRRMARHLGTPGPVVDGNESAATLEGFTAP